jgi:hypothetical protein
LKQISTFIRSITKATSDTLEALAESQKDVIDNFVDANLSGVEPDKLILQKAALITTVIAVGLIAIACISTLIIVVGLLTEKAVFARQDRKRRRKQAYESVPTYQNARELTTFYSEPIYSSYESVDIPLPPPPPRRKVELEERYPSTNKPKIQHV